jgi:hypothetical protein
MAKVTIMVTQKKCHDIKDSNSQNSTTKLLTMLFLHIWFVLSLEWPWVLQVVLTKMVQFLNLMHKLMSLNIVLCKKHLFLVTTIITW